MADPTRSQNTHQRNVQTAIVLLLAASCLGFFWEIRSQANQQAQLPAAQGLMTQESSALGLSGGRARGGSFSRPSAPSGGGSMPRTAPSYGGGYSGGSGGSYYPSSPYYPRGRGTVVIPAPYPGYVPTYPSYPSAPAVGNDIGLLFLLLILGFAVLPLIVNLLKLRGSSSGSGTGGSSELANDVVTVTQLQVALLAQARYLQTELTDLTAKADLDNPAEVSQLLQETVLALLRSPENWSHARVTSQTIRSREQAAQLFEQLSVVKRSKFSRETLVNVGGEIRRQTVTPREDADPAAYIIVTLLVGTADDRPLITAPIYSPNDLKAALQRLGGISPDYLLIYELLWTPQDPTDSLSYDEMLASYPDLAQIA